MFPPHNQPIDLKNTLVDMSSYRATERGNPDPLVVHIIYTQDNQVYESGRIITLDAPTYEKYKTERPNDIVNKFGRVYRDDFPLLLHRKLADVIIDAAIDMHTRYGQFTVVMDGLRTFDSGRLMEQNRPDLVELGLLAKAGSSAHNRALAVDSKLFVRDEHGFLEADEHGHLDDLDMKANSRFYQGAMSDAARTNRQNRIAAWQRASVKNKLPVANLLAEFWDDRLPGSPADMWRVLACRALCIEADGNPATNATMQSLKNALNSLYGQNQDGALTRQQFAEKAHTELTHTWNELFTPEQKNRLDALLGTGGGEPPALEDFIFHEWLETIHDHHLIAAGFPAQSRA